jgi:hypothetical protein
MPQVELYVTPHLISSEGSQPYILHPSPAYKTKRRQSAFILYFAGGSETDGMGKYVGAFITLVVAAVVALGVIAFVSSAGQQRPSETASNAGFQVTSGGAILKHVNITLQTFPFDPYSDPDFVASHITGKTDNGLPWPGAGDNQAWVKYEPTTDLIVPSNALVTITIQNYDSATPLLNPYYATPRGIDGPMMVDGKAVATVDPMNVSHTFTIHAIPQTGQDWLFVSVPLTGDDSTQTDAAGMPNAPVTTVFSFVTPSRPGHYIWQCFDPCGAGYNGFGGPMSTKGFMSGTLTVQ